MLEKIAEIANELDKMNRTEEADILTSVLKRIAENENKPLNKPVRTPQGPKKFTVYVKDKGKTKKVNFGDPNMEIKRDDPERRKNYRARHHCENPGPKTKANYWSCKMWQSGKSVTDMTKKKETKSNFSNDDLLIKLAIIASELDELNMEKEADVVDAVMQNVAKKKKKMQGEDPCWENYEMIGLKPNGDPNCVPKK